MRVLFENSKYLNKVLLVVGLADLRDLIKVFNDDLLMFIQELEDVVIVIVERVAIDLGGRTKLSNSYVGELFVF